MSNARIRIAAVLALGVLCLWWIARSEADETSQRGNLRVSFDAQLRPTRLPRHGTAPIAVTVSGRIATTDGTTPPQLRRIEIAINRNGRLDPTGLPSCRLEEIQPATTANALAACGDAKVGEGSVAADVVIPEQSPVPSAGRLVAFNGFEDGRPVIFAHVYGTKPIPTSYTLTLRIGRAKGKLATTLSADLPAVAANVAFITSISLKLERRYGYHGERRSYLSAGCPAPPGYPGAIFPLAKASFGFADGRSLGSTLVRSCKASG